MTPDKPLLSEPEAPEDWECCGSECGEACIHDIYRRELAAYRAQQRALAETAQTADPPPTE